MNIPKPANMVTCPMCLGEKITREEHGDFMCDGCGGRGLVTEFWAGLLERYRPQEKPPTNTPPQLDPLILKAWDTAPTLRSILFQSSTWSAKHPDANILQWLGSDLKRIGLTPDDQYRLFIFRTIVCY